MRLKSIKLAGFKSFVDATTVPFPTNMTSIVGPNGCGKSNIIDAVRWVMGESSAKNLRGESMTDVIFNGSTGRQPVGQASIELLFDNTEGKLEGEHGAFSEISIKRKVTREGISQYYLNGTKCRRRDVTDIFLGTGMGPRSYAIIEQGMIARLIESKPEELRVYLEEAAGISKYKERRRDTENRMRRTQENLDRLSDIRDELGKQLQHLKRQANAAEKYAEYKQEERHDTAKLNAVRWQKLESERSVLASEAEQLAAGIEQAVLDKNTHEGQIEAARTSLEEHQENFNRVQAKFYESGAEVAKLEQQLKFQREQLARQDRELSSLQQEEDHLLRVLEQDEPVVAVLHEELDDLLPEEEAFAERIEICREELAEKESALQAWQQSWDQFNQSSAQTRQQAEIQQARIQNSENQIRQLEERNHRLAQELGQLEDQLNEQDGDLVMGDRAELEAQAGHAQSVLEDRRQQLRSMRQQAEAIANKRAQVQKDAAEQRAVLASLNTLQAAALDEEGVEDVLQKNGVEVKQPFLASIKVQDGWEKAFEHAIAPWIKSLECEEVQGYSQSFHEDVNIALIQPSDGGGQAARKGSLSAVVSGAESLMPWFDQILLAESRKQAATMIPDLAPGESVICRDGCWMSRYWVRFYSEQGSGGVVKRAQQIDELEKSLPATEQKLANLEQEQEEHGEAIRSLEEELAQEEKQLGTLNSQLSQLVAQEKVFKAKSEQLHLRISRVKDELQEIALNREAETEKLGLSREEWQEAMLALENLVDERGAQQERRENLQHAVEHSRQQLHGEQQSFHQMQLTLQQKKSELERLKAGIDRSRHALQQVRDKIKELEGADHIDARGLEDVELRLEGLLDTRLQDEEKLASARCALEEAQLKLREIESQRGKKETRLQELRMALESRRMDIQALVMKQANHIEHIENDAYQLHALLSELSDEETEPELEKRLQTLAARIQRLGAINLAAIDEYKEQGARKEYLDSQHEDLSEALDTLLTAIRKIDKETRARFKETYDQVNEGLQRLFPKIFGGGSAHLELTDDDLLETGVAIIARPPGKKNSTIHLLSGGEKALTAIALIFAIFELNPAPFCMLDEVDAPLDDANVGRFANMVKEMSERVQFIYISHNKVSMEMADQLMGVTMHEPGVSRLVSVDVEEAAALAEA